MISKEQRAALAAPFPRSAVKWRVAKKNKDNGKNSGEVVCYIDARDAMERLDDVFGIDGWSFDAEPLTIGKDSKTGGDIVTAAKGTLTIGASHKSDFGDAGNYEPTKASASDALKRAAVHYGVARYLYEMPARWVELDSRGNIPAATLKELNASLPAPDDKPITPELAAVLLAWYPTLGDKISALSTNKAIEMISAGTPPAPKAKTTQKPAPATQGKEAA